jgi:transcriptional regulator with XRE-family HTH domain
VLLLVEKKILLDSFGVFYYPCKRLVFVNGAYYTTNECEKQLSRDVKMKKISERIRELRGDKSQVAAARQLGIAQQGWARYESGAALPGAEVLHRICCRFSVSADWLLGFTDNRQGIATPTPDAAALAKIAALEAENAALKDESTRLKAENTAYRFALEAIGKGK